VVKTPAHARPRAATTIGILIHADEPPKIRRFVDPSIKHASIDSNATAGLLPANRPLHD